MPFDFAPPPSSPSVPPKVAQQRALRGKVSYYDGLAAEDIAAREYLAEGSVLLETRWRGAGGEIDLIFKEGETYVFVEVKKAKTIRLASERLDWRQIGRIVTSAEQYVARECPGLPPLMRLDAAFVDGQGMCERIHNISM